MAKLISQDNKQAFRNPWVIGWVAMVSLVFAVNVFFVAKAFMSNPGLVSKRYYDVGQDLEKSIQSRKSEQAELGWQVQLDAADIHVGKPAFIRVVASGQDGKPLAVDNVALRAIRPADSSADFSRTMEPKAAGEYVSELTFSLKGVWDLVIDLKQGEHAQQVTRRVIVLGD